MSGGEKGPIGGALMSVASGYSEASGPDTASCASYQPDHRPDPNASGYVKAGGERPAPEAGGLRSPASFAPGAAMFLGTRPTTTFSADLITANLDSLLAEAKANLSQMQRLWTSHIRHPSASEITKCLNRWSDYTGVLERVSTAKSGVPRQLNMSILERVMGEIRDKGGLPDPSKIAAKLAEGTRVSGPPTVVGPLPTSGQITYAQLVGEMDVEVALAPRSPAAPPPVPDAARQPAAARQSPPPPKAAPPTEGTAAHTPTSRAAASGSPPKAAPSAPPPAAAELAPSVSISQPPPARAVQVGEVTFGSGGTAEPQITVPPPRSGAAFAKTEFQPSPVAGTSAHGTSPPPAARVTRAWSKAITPLGVLGTLVGGALLVFQGINLGNEMNARDNLAKRTDVKDAEKTASDRKVIASEVSFGAGALALGSGLLTLGAKALGWTAVAGGSAVVSTVGMVVGIIAMPFYMHYKGKEDAEFNDRVSGLLADELDQRNLDALERRAQGQVPDRLTSTAVLTALAKFAYKNQERARDPAFWSNPDYRFRDMLNVMIARLDGSGGLERPSDYETSDTMMAWALYLAYHSDQAHFESTKDRAGFMRQDMGMNCTFSKFDELKDALSANSVPQSQQLCDQSAIGGDAARPASAMSPPVVTPLPNSTAPQAAAAPVAPAPPQAPAQRDGTSNGVALPKPPAAGVEAQNPPAAPTPSPAPSAPSAAPPAAPVKAQPDMAHETEEAEEPEELPPEEDDEDSGEEADPPQP